MSFTPQANPWTLSGPIASRPLATARGLEPGYRYYATDEDKEYLLAGEAWHLVGGGAAGLSSKYWVNAAGQTPVVGYTTIQSAIDAAVDDGASAAKPAAIMIYQGLYTEAVVTVPAGISLVGMGGTYTEGGPGIIGLISLTGAAGSNVISGIVNQGGIVVGSAASQPIKLYLNNVSVFGSGGSAVSLIANDVTVTAKSSQFQGDNAPSFHCDSAGTGYSGDLFSCEFKGPGGGVNGQAIQLTGGTWTFHECTFQIRTDAPSICKSFSNTDVVVAKFYNCILAGEGNAASVAVIVEDGAGEYWFYGSGTSIVEMAATMVLTSGGAPTVRCGGGPNLGAYSVANLPVVTSLDVPARAYAIGGLKAGGAATGVPVYRDTGTNAWLTCSGDSPP